MEATGPLREVRTWDEAIAGRSSDKDVHEAILLTAGERGYEKTTVQEVAERARISTDSFYRRFESKESCFAAAYAKAIDDLCQEVLDSCWGAEDWRSGFEAALSTLLEFVAEQPLLAKALLIEVKAARGDAWVKHQAAVELLTGALDGAREEPGARPAATPMTAGFIVGAIEESLCIEIGAGRTAQVQRLLPDLTHLAMLQFFGADTGGEETDAATK